MPSVASLRSKLRMRCTLQYSAVVLYVTPACTLKLQIPYAISFFFFGTVHFSRVTGAP